MTLNDYFSAVPGRQADLARSLDLPTAQVWQWKEGIRPVPMPYVTRIETATDGAVRRWDLRPSDWHLIWPELIEADGAPSLPEKAGV